MKIRIKLTLSFYMRKPMEAMGILCACEITKFLWPRSVFAAIKKLLNKFTRGSNDRLCSICTPIKVIIDKTSGNCVERLSHKK